MVHSPSGVHQPDTYVCWDYYSSLNPFGFCQWRGLFRQGPKTYSIFNDEIQEMKNQGVNLKGLKWSNDLSKAAASELGMVRKGVAKLKVEEIKIAGLDNQMMN